MKLVLSPSAIRDLETIPAYTLQNWGVEQEEYYLKGLWARLAEIQSKPSDFRLRNDLARGCRSARYQIHVVFFSVAGDTLEGESAFCMERWISTVTCHELHFPPFFFNAR